jgi:hypothetical protein
MQSRLSTPPDRDALVSGQTRYMPTKDTTTLSAESCCASEGLLPGLPDEALNRARDWGNTAGSWSELSPGSIGSGDCVSATNGEMIFTRLY